eukprot:scaffold7951_cov123-Cylindrotheca_fusiformis.AAC.1
MALLEQQSCFQLSWSAALIGPIDELKQMMRTTTITCVLDIQGNFDGTKSKEPRPTTSCTTTSQQASK